MKVRKRSISAFLTNVVITLVAMPNSIIAYCLGLGADVARIAIAVVLCFHFLK